MPRPRVVELNLAVELVPKLISLCQFVFAHVVTRTLRKRSSYPPGTSKWNKIEHRLFSWITRNWRGRPLLSHAVIVSLIQNTKTRSGLRIQAELDTHSYSTSKKVTREELAEVRHLLQEKFGDWNYIILPKQDMPEPNRSLIL